MTSIQILRLQDLLISLGINIDTDVANEIKKHIFNGQPSFCMDADTLLGEAVKLGIRLTCVKSAEPQDYVLLNYRVTYHIPNDPANDRSQTFDMTGGMPVNLNEAFNLLHGRAVFKEISPATDEKYFAWIQLDFQKKDSEGNYRIMKFRSYLGYDLALILNRYPILELNDPDQKKAIIRGLKSGNRKIVTFLKPSGRAESKFIEFNPMHKSINIYAVPKSIQKVK